MRHRFVAVLILVTAAAAAAQSVDPQVMLESARKKEVVDGDYRAAITIYQSIVTRFAKSDRRTAATALVRMADCYEKLGLADAQATLERVVAEFGDQSEQVVEARSRLASLQTTRGAGGNVGSPGLVCTGEGCAHRAASVSADGRWIVMGGAVWGGGALGLRNMVTGEVTKLSAMLRPGDEKRHADEAVFSADGRQIAFIWGDDISELRVIGSEPATRSRVLVDAPGVRAVPIAWSRDYSRILAKVWRYDVAFQNETAQLAWVSTSDGSINAIKLLDRRVRSETGLHEVTLSPDERFIVYSALTTDPPPQVRPGSTLQNFVSAEQHLYIVPSDGSAPAVELMNTRGIDHNPIWTADGRHILFSSNRNGTTDLWALPMRDGGAAGLPFRVKPNIGMYFNLGVTSAGLLYYWQLQPTLREVHVVELDTNGRLPATPRLTHRFPGRLPSWSPDGQLLAMAHGGLTPADDKIIVHSLQTGSDQVFTPAAIPDRQAIWMPDSSGFLQIVASRNPFVRHWQKMDLTRGALEEITNLGDPGFFEAPSLSSDARTLYRLGGEKRSPTGELAKEGEFSQIVAVDTSTAAERLVFTLPNHRGSAGGPALSPDGRTLAFSWQPPQKLGTWIVATVGIDGVGYRELATITGAPAGLNWTRDAGALLYVAAGTRPVCRLMRVHVSSGVSEFTGLEFRGGQLGCQFSAGLDGRRIAFQTSESAQELWVIDVSEAPLKKQAR